MALNLTPARSRRFAMDAWPWAVLGVALLDLAAFGLLPDTVDTPFLILFQKLDGQAVWLALAITLLALGIRDRQGRMAALFSWVDRHPRELAWLALLVCALGARTVYLGQAYSMDEQAQRVQSQVFASGHLFGAMPPAWLDWVIPSGFQGEFFQVSHATGQYASAYWPSLSLLMTPLTWVGLPWMCNPLLTGLSFVVLARLLRVLLDDPVARGFALLATFASPAILINGMSGYGMPLQLLCTTSFTLCLLSATPARLLLAGAVAAIGLTTVNPLPFALSALPWLFHRGRHPGQRWSRLGWMACTGVPLGLALGLGWKLLLNAQLGAVDTGVAGMAGGWLHVFKLPSLGLLGVRGIGLVKLSLWAVPGLLVVAMLGWTNLDKRPVVVTLSASAALTLAAYLFVPFDQGNGWGYRYFHAAWLSLPVLGALGLEALRAAPQARQRLIGFVGTSCLASLLLALPLSMGQVHWLLRHEAAQLPPPIPGPARQLVFVDMQCGFETPDLLRNDADLRGRELFLVSHGDAADAAFARQFGGHPHAVAKTPCATRWALD